MRERHGRKFVSFLGAPADDAFKVLFQRVGFPLFRRVRRYRSLREEVEQRRAFPRVPVGNALRVIDVFLLFLFVPLRAVPCISPHAERFEKRTLNGMRKTAIRAQPCLDGRPCVAFIAHHGANGVRRSVGWHAECLVAEPVALARFEQCRQARRTFLDGIKVNPRRRELIEPRNHKRIALDDLKRSVQECELECWSCREASRDRCNNDWLTVLIREVLAPVFFPYNLRGNPDILSGSPRIAAYPEIFCVWRKRETGIFGALFWRETSESLRKNCLPAFRDLVSSCALRRNEIVGRFEPEISL